MNYNEIRRSVGRDLFEIFILPVDPKRLGLDAGVAGDRRRKRDFARWFVWPGQLFGWNVAGRYCTGLKIPWRHPNRHERECGPLLPSPPTPYFQDCSPGGESFRTLERACSRTRRHSTTSFAQRVLLLYF